jgi:hypothetical protein
MPQERRHHAHHQPVRTFARLHYAFRALMDMEEANTRHLRNTTTRRAPAPPEAPPLRCEKLQPTPGPTAIVTPTSNTDAEGGAGQPWPAVAGWDTHASRRRRCRRHRVRLRHGRRKTSAGQRPLTANRIVQMRAPHCRCSTGHIRTDRGPHAEPPRPPAAGAEVGPHRPPEPRQTHTGN